MDRTTKVQEWAARGGRNMKEAVTLEDLSALERDGLLSGPDAAPGDSSTAAPKPRKPRKPRNR